MSSRNYRFAISETLIPAYVHSLGKILVLHEITGLKYQRHSFLHCVINWVGRTIGNNTNDVNLGIHSQTMLKRRGR